MEDLKLRLKYSDINIRSRCLQKLLSAVKTKAKGNTINSSSVQIPELNLILEACEDDSPVTSNLAVQVIISLVKDNYMDIDYAFSKLLGSMKSSSNFQSVINGISSLLIHAFSKSVDNKIPKYSLLFPKHPLITALEDKNDCFPFVVENIAEFVSSDFSRGIRVMEPVICYILCNPLQKQEVNYKKVLFLDVFTSCQMDLRNLALHLFKFIPFLQIEFVHQAVEVTLFIRKLNEIVAQADSDDVNSTLFNESMLLFAFSVIEKNIAFGHNPSYAIDLLIELFPSLPKVEKFSIPVNICLVIMSQMMKSASGELLNKAVLLGLELLDFPDISPTVAAILAVTVINLLPEPSLMLFSDSIKLSLSKLLTKLEYFYVKSETAICDNTESSSEDETFGTPYLSKEFENKTFNLFEAFTQTTEVAFTCVKFSKILDKCNIKGKLKWLEYVKKYANSSNEDNFDMIYSLVAALILMSHEDEMFLNSSLETLECVLLNTPSLSTRAFSMLLYKMSCVECPKSKLAILNFLPKSAVHKYAIPPVLGILQMMTKETELKAQAICLMLQLWKKQDRCFPYLENLLTESNKPFTFESGVNEILIAQAAAILEICLTKPEKHGQKFLDTLSSIFNKCHDEASLPVACLAIDGIIALCRSEIIEVRSTWKALSARLTRDKRTLVLCRMYQLLALIPELKVKSFEYDKFMSETVANLWKFISSGTSNGSVLSEAFKTLGKFPMDCHVLKQLPAAAKGNLKLPASMKATPFEMSKLPEDVLSYIPGYCFIDLLVSFDDKIILEGYVSFLHSLVKMEVEELPRSVYSQTRHVVKQKKISEALSKVPGFLCNQFQSGKSPALQKNLAVGVLFSYEPPIELGKDGFPIKRSVAAQYRSYEQVLTVLLNEVNIDATEWHRCILISNAWGAFMERGLFACEEARRADLELQSAHGHINLSPEELSIQFKSAWLWVRDRFLGIIKANVKNTATAHANAIFAISGLVFALDKFYSSLDDNSKAVSDESDKYIIHRHFVAEYVETVICAMYPDYIPTGKVQSWLLTHLSRPNSSTGYLVIGCASASLCHLTPVLISYYNDDIPKLMDIMLQNLGHSSPVLSFYSGKGIGYFIKSLCATGYLDAGKSQLDLLLNTVKEMMKMYEDSEGQLTGCLISLTISMAYISQTSDETIKDWISTTCNIFYEKLMDEEKSSMQFEILCICVTAMIISATEGSCLPIQNVEDLLSWIEMNRLELPQCSGISVSLGMLIEAFERFGHSISDGAEIKQKVLKGWLNTITSERKPTLQKIAALNGLCSMISCGRGLIQVQPQSSPESVSILNDLIPVMFQILSATRDTGLQSICSWEVGRLFSVHSNQQQVESSASGSYSYLGEKSVLKPLMNVIISYQKEDETSYKYCHVLSCLKALASPFPRPLPPINWITILTPFLQQNDDPEAVESALKVALYQCNGSNYATNLVSSYCNPPLIHTLPESCFKILLENIPALALSLPAPKLQVYLQTVISHTIKREEKFKTLGDITLLVCRWNTTKFAMRLMLTWEKDSVKPNVQKVANRRKFGTAGILNSLKQTGYKEQTKKAIKDAFIVIFKFFKTRDDYMRKYLIWISEALLVLPDEMLNSQLLISQNTDDVALLTMVWCHLIKTGKKPLSNLRSCIEEGKCCSQEQKEKICFYVYDCFLNGIHCEESELSQAKKCTSWLLETIGWIRVLEDTKSKYQLLTTGEVYTFLVDVCLATIIGCSGLENSYSLLPQNSLGHHSLLESFPQAIRRLSQKTHWNSIIDKVIDWLLLLLSSPYFKENEKYYIILALCSLKSTNQFQKAEIWTEVLSNVISK